MMEEYLIYDLEIKKAILKNGEQSIPGIEYCAGWDDHANMGISVLCAYDCAQQKFLFIDDHSKDYFVELCENKTAVGFNNIRFDNAVIRAAWGERYVPPHCKDILLAIWKSLKLDPDNFIYNTHGGYGLDAMAEKNLGKKKTGNGAYAPVQWQQGRYAELYSYCLNDVALTYRLLRHAVKQGYLLSPKDGDCIATNLCFPLC